MSRFPGLDLGVGDPEAARHFVDAVSCLPRGPDEECGVDYRRDVCGHVATTTIRPVRPEQQARNLRSFAKFTEPIRPSCWSSMGSSPSSPWLAANSLWQKGWGHFYGPYISARSERRTGIGLSRSPKAR